MEEQRLVAHDQVLVETEPFGARDGDRCVYPEDAVRNFLDVRAAVMVRDQLQFSSWLESFRHLDQGRVC
jgi:hypothetical protein